MVLVFFTTIVFGALMPFVVKYFDQINESNVALEKIDLNSINNSDNLLETYEFQRYEKINSNKYIKYHIYLSSEMLLLINLKIIELMVIRMRVLSLKKLQDYGGDLIIIS